LTIILPGIESESFANSNVAQGLQDGGVDTAIEVHDWTTGKILNVLDHLRDLERNKIAASKIADKIVDYQDRYPGRPVYLIGHSGGGGMTLLTLEALPADRHITAAILLAAAISPTYDLTTALEKTDAGIWNYYSAMDSTLLIAGTTVAGTIDGKHVPAAGAFGFEEPAGDFPERHRLYETKLHQIGYDLQMVTSGNLGGHFGPTWHQFSEDYLAPILIDPYSSQAVGREPRQRAGVVRIGDLNSESR
jgi:pimeloyl-ACP methyl ester carboxylesterase